MHVGLTHQVGNYNQINLILFFGGFMTIMVLPQIFDRQKLWQNKFCGWQMSYFQNWISPDVSQVKFQSHDLDLGSSWDPLPE